MDYIWCCECGHEWECDREDQALGAVVQCEKCLGIWAHIRTRSGTKKWFPLDPEKAHSPYYDILSPPHEEE